MRRLAPAVLGVVLATHLAVMLLFDHWSAPKQQVDVALANPIEVLLLDPEPPPMVAPPLKPTPTQRPTSIARSVTQRSAGPVTVATPAIVAELLPADRPALRLFAADGALVNVDDHVRVLDAKAGANATFEYQIAGIAEAEAAFTLPQAIEVNATRFDRYWQPTANLLDEVLEKAVKASTLVVSVPVPGMPGYRVGCAVVVIAAAGGCGMSEPKLSVYDIDDPTTLDPAEAEACQTLWEKITSAGAQESHRRLRQIYDLGCRLPLAGERKVEFR